MDLVTYITWNAVKSRQCRPDVAFERNLLGSMRRYLSARNISRTGPCYFDFLISFFKRSNIHTRNNGMYTGSFANNNLYTHQYTIYP